MKFTTLLSTVAVAATLFATTASAQDAAVKGAITARQSLMKLYAFNLGTLGAMAQGKMDYDAEAASAALIDGLAYGRESVSDMSGQRTWL